MRTVQFLETHRGVTQPISLPIAPQGRWGLECHTPGCSDSWAERRWHNPETTHRHSDMYGCPNKHHAYTKGTVAGILAEDVELIEHPDRVHKRTWWHASDSNVATFDGRALHVGSREAADLRSIEHQFRGKTWLYAIKLDPRTPVSPVIYVERDGFDSLERVESLPPATSPIAFRYVNVREAPGSVSLMLLGMDGTAAPRPRRLAKLPTLLTRSQPLYL